MTYLVDTNVLLRWGQPGDLQNPVAVAAIGSLRGTGNSLVVAPQNLVEFWNVMTRPQDRNGFGRTLVQTDAEVKKIESLFPMLEESPAVYAEWRQLVVSAGVSGVQVHDARLAAIMRVHSVTHLLTFNAKDFPRYGVTVVEPKDVPLAGGRGGG